MDEGKCWIVTICDPDLSWFFILADKEGQVMSWNTFEEANDDLVYADRVLRKDMMTAPWSVHYNIKLSIVYKSELKVNIRPELLLYMFPYRNGQSHGIKIPFHFANRLRHIERSKNLNYVLKEKTNA